MTESLSELPENLDPQDSAQQEYYFETQSFLATESQDSDLITDGLHQRQNWSQHHRISIKGRLASSGEDMSSEHSQYLCC